MRRLPALIAVTLVPLLLPVSGRAQAQGGSILWLVPPAGRLAAGTETTGTLSSSDFFGPNDIYIDVWEIDGRAGAALTIDMKSDDFDTVLFVIGPGLAGTLWDDDGGGSCNSRISVRFLEDGVYRIGATTTESRTTGVYTLLASADPAPASTVPCGGPAPAEFDALPVAGTATIGEPISGTLDAADPVLADDSHAEVWELTGEPGTTVTIRLESDAFDSFLYITGPGLDSVITDDDSGGDLHSQIVLTFPAAGTYRVIVSSVESGGTGAYRLTITR